MYNFLYLIQITRGVKYIILPLLVDAGAPACGKVGKVEKIDNDGDVMVQFGDQLGVYSPACLIPAPGKKIDMIKNASTSTTTPGAPASTRKGKMIYFTPS
jgi:hypothetical protein